MIRLSARQCGYGAAVFLTSAGGLVLEIVAGRLLAPYVGMSLYTWTAIIAVVLAGFSIGHWIGGNLAGEGCDRTAGAQRVAVALALAAISSMASLVLLRWLSGPLLGAGWSPVAAIVALAAALFLAPSLFVGIVSPILTKLAVDDAAGRHGPAIGRMYALGALGSIAGTLAAGYLFISWIGSTGTVLAVAATYAVLALVFAVPGRAATALTVVLAMLGGSFGYAGYRAKAFVSPCRIESDYYCIRIDNFAQASGRPSAIMVLDHLAHGINDRDDPGLLYSTYLHFLDEYARRLLPTREALQAFVVGGGALTLPRAWAHDRPGAAIRVAEIDPAVTGAAAAYMWATPTNGLRIDHGDGRLILQSLPMARQFDVILGDAFHDISIPAHLVTKEFHAQIHARLKPDGFYAVNVIEGGPRPLFLLSLLRTLAEEFISVEVWVDATELDAATRITYVIIAADLMTPFGRLQSTRGLQRNWVRLPSPDLAHHAATLGVPILTDDYAPVDRLLAHVIFDPELAER
ncbi:MAG: fused MFS/spermidine synthase [Proteobacteria bacterium]|nr:fused MFS/spermidine synthase [Pseudomonadota bacterium]